jgi:hypothetical protein
MSQQWCFFNCACNRDMTLLLRSFPHQIEEAPVMAANHVTPRVLETDICGRRATLCPPSYAAAAQMTSAEAAADRPASNWGPRYQSLGRQQLSRQLCNCSRSSGRNCCHLPTSQFWAPATQAGNTRHSSRPRWHSLPCTALSACAGSVHNMLGGEGTAKLLQWPPRRPPSGCPKSSASGKDKVGLATPVPLLWTWCGSVSLSRMCVSKTGKRSANGVKVHSAIVSSKYSMAAK